MSNCCGDPPKEPEQKVGKVGVASCCAPAAAPKASACCGPATAAEGESCHPKASIDYLLWGSLALCVAFYGLYVADIDVGLPQLHHLGHSVFELLNTMWWGVLLGIFFVGILARIPQTLILSVLGRGGSVNGLLRATFAGVLLDLCSHGILMVGMKLYQKGASLGQVMAFLIASPWNSFSLTLIMFALIGVKWTLAFIALSILIALVSGWVFDRLVQRGTLPANPNSQALPEHFRFWPELRKQWQGIQWRPQLLVQIGRDGLSGAQMVLRWLLFGVLLAALIRTFVSLDVFQQWFGPSILGLVLTLVAATVIEVCSEGSTPIAADLMTRANAPGNSFTFLMAGVSTDYTEIMSIRDTTTSWKIPLFLPLITLPQIVVIGLLLNHIHG